MLSQPHARADVLGRYYTKTDIGQLVVTQMESRAPNRLLDLGAGQGSLSSAAIERWPTLDLLTVDIDRGASAHLKRAFTSKAGLKHSHLCADALSARLPELIFPKFDEFDAAVCNPPFTVARWRNGFGQILEATGFSGSIPYADEVDAALIFLAQNLRLLRRHARLAIILPDSLVSAQRYQRFRKDLVERYSVSKVIRLPRGSFQRTDALASLVILSNEKPSNGLVSLFNFQADTGLSPALVVDNDQASERLDYAFHVQQLKHSRPEESASERRNIVLDVNRGSITRSKARGIGVPAFHTTDISTTWLGQWCDLSRWGESEERVAAERRAEPGDILVARVGRNLERKVIGVKIGRPVITDCVYRVRVPREYQKRLLDQLSGQDGSQWLASRAYGVGAKQLTKSDLLTFPFNSN